MSAEHRRAIEEFFEAGGALADRATLARFFDREYVSHSAPPGAERGTSHAETLRTYLEATFSDVSYEVVHVVSEGEMAAAHVVMHATHTGDGLGIKPTGRRVRAAQMHFVRFSGEKVVEHWAVRDDAELARQLGAKD